ncbi:MAG: hypothetical protein M0C28_40520 [Candidatus Moduliflexus flocculans]|nr:hypothetical protein [Candidatus Moduliflexus flocculans]
MLIPIALHRVGGFAGLHAAVPDYMFQLFGSAATQRVRLVHHPGHGPGQPGLHHRRGHGHADGRLGQERDDRAGRHDRRHVLQARHHDLLGPDRPAGHRPLFGPGSTTPTSSGAT